MRNRLSNVTIVLLLFVISSRIFFLSVNILGDILILGIFIDCCL